MKKFSLPSKHENSKKRRLPASLELDKLETERAKRRYVSEFLSSELGALSLHESEQDSCTQSSSDNDRSRYTEKTSSTRSKHVVIVTDLDADASDSENSEIGDHNNNQKNNHIKNETTIQIPRDLRKSLQKIPQEILVSRKKEENPVQALVLYRPPIWPLDSLVGKNKKRTGNKTSEIDNTDKMNNNYTTSSISEIHKSRIIIEKNNVSNKAQESPVVALSSHIVNNSMIEEDLIPSEVEMDVDEVLPALEGEGNVSLESVVAAIPNIDPFVKLTTTPTARRRRNSFDGYEGDNDDDDSALDQNEQESSQHGDTNDNNQVALSNKTQALLESPRMEQPSPEGSIHESTNDINKEEHTHLQTIRTLLSYIVDSGGGETSRETSPKTSPKTSSKEGTRIRFNRATSKGGISEPLTKEQLAAPYVEEERPEKPEIFRYQSDDIIGSSNTWIVDGEGSHVNSGNDNSGGQKAKHHLSAIFKKAAALAAVNKVLVAADGRQHLKNDNAYMALTPTFPSPLAVPFFWLKRDSRGRRAPPILLNMLKLAITDSEYDETYFNFQNIFRIELEYGDVKWVIKRTGINFSELALKLIKSRNELPDLPTFPANLAHWFLAKIWPGTLENRHRRQRDAALERRKHLEKYLLELLKVLNFYVCYDLYEFLELSVISITRDMGWKGKEGYMRNKVQRFRTPLCSFSNTSERWEREWVIVRDSYIAFCSSIDSPTPSDVFLLDSTFKYEKNTSGMFMFKLHDHVTLKNYARQIEIKADSRTLAEFTESIERVKVSSPWLKQHQYESYAPIRENVKVKWYVDGKDYFHAVSEAILAAKSEIYIEDWWLSPELYLRRPTAQNEEFRLDKLLKKKAEEGIMIYIVVYKEVSLAFYMDSHHTKFTLRNMHPNIKVQRHPDHGPEGIMFWAHHEKILVVDCRIAFLGGLDLCFGRYDTHTHELADNHPDKILPDIWPGQDYSNPRIKDFDKVAEWARVLVDKSKVPPRDVARHFVQRWNFIKDEKAIGRETLPFLTPKGEYVSTRDESRFKGTCNVQLLRSSAEWSSGVKQELSIYNAYIDLIRKSKHFIYIENQFFVTSTGESDKPNPIQNIIGQELVNRIIKAHAKGEKFRVIVIMPLLPAFEADLASKDAGTIRMVMHWQYVSICRGGHSVLDKLKALSINPEDYISFFALRSYDRIKCNPIEDDKNSQNNSDNKSQTTGDHNPQKEESLKQKGKEVEETEDSSNSLFGNQNIYALDSIAARALGLASIETTSTHEQQQQRNSNSVQKEDSFSDEQAYGHEKFEGVEPPLASGYRDTNHGYVTEELYVHTKLLIVDDRYVVCGSANLNDRSQLGNRDSEIAVLVEDKLTVTTRMNGEIYQASKFAYTLRSFLFKEHLGLIPPQAHHSVTKSSLPPINPEDLYNFHVRGHSKGHSVTDIIGKHSSTGGTPSKHPTKEDLIVMDPLSDEFYDCWVKTARTNTEAFRAVFRCVPDDNVTDWTEYKNFVPDATKVPAGHVANTLQSPEEIQQKLDKVRGHLVEFPLHFLEKENLMGSVISYAVTPAEIFI
ncbi:5229_t:CDS:10 [Ambispora gerdemannii]|uniref:Phospholipase n=1 Tax=Ambispora gerdemannii TaxID=144530 RepID=A0A9N8WPH0_9GLOM|nr:5229_t:CDS:10 [Ambispora gerdemannii]